jgi:DNA polymerase-3 subunit epsilon
MAKRSSASDTTSRSTPASCASRIKRHVDPREKLALAVSDEWKAGKAICTARLATPIMKLPPTAKMRAAGRHHPKTANLGEAYLHFTGKPLEGAHDAMVDVLACTEVYFAIKDRGAKE